MRTLILLCLLLGGCSTTMTKPGTSEAQFQADYARCKFEAARRDGVAWPDEVGLCMSGKGYIVS